MAWEVRYAVDITIQDVEAVEAFLMARTAEQLAAHESDTAEYRMAVAVERFTQDLVSGAQLALEWLADPEQSEIFGELELRHDLMNAWNILVGATRPWRHYPAHDEARWRKVTYTDAQFEKEHERSMESARTAREATSRA